LELSTDRVIGTPKLSEIPENRGFKEDRPVIDGQGKSLERSLYTSAPKGTKRSEKFGLKGARSNPK
jgi:hypothetical protein